MRRESRNPNAGRQKRLHSLASKLAPGAAALLALLLALPAAAQPLTIATLAGTAGQGFSDGNATNARFAHPWSVAADTNGNLYVADTDNHIIRKISADGAVTTLAGTPGVAGTADGTNGGALFNQPQGLAVDPAGNLYLADTANHTLRKITPAGVVTTFAGSAGNPGTNNGTGTNALFDEPEAVAVNAAGTLLYVADTWNHTIRQITAATAAVTPFVGSPGSFGTNDGQGSSALFYQPQGLAVDGAGNVYVADTGNHTIRKVSPAGHVTTLAGSPLNYGSTNATGGNARFRAPAGLALDSATNLYVADSLNHTLRQVTPAGAVTTLAGIPGSFGSADGTGAAARFWLPQGVAVDNAGRVYVADSANSAVRRITGALVTTFAGSASSGAADGLRDHARFGWPAAVANDRAGNAYLADTLNATIRKVNPVGAVTTLAGLAGSFGTNDGSGGNARFFGPQGTAVDASGNLYVADTANHAIRKLTSDGAVTTLAGLPGTSGLSDGSTTNARFNSPKGLAVDAGGNVYVADSWNHTIRRVTPGGAVTTLAGVPGYAGDIDGAGAGTGTNAARFYCPGGLAVDAATNLYVADTWNHTLRQVTAAGLVRTLVGMPGVWGSADGTNSDARFYLPQSVGVAPAGNLYVLDSGNHTIRRVSQLGTNWVVTTVAGAPDLAGNADGTGANARLSYPAGLGLNSAGLIYVADWGNNTLRVGLPFPDAGPGIQTQPADQIVRPGQDATFSVEAAGLQPLAYQWRFDGTNLAGATTSTYTCTNAQSGNAGPYSVIVTNLAGAIASSNALLIVALPALPGHFDSLSLLPDGSLHLNLSGSPYTNYILEFTSTWTNWTPLATLSAPNGLFSYTDPFPTNAERFYRLRLSP